MNNTDSTINILQSTLGDLAQLIQCYRQAGLLGETESAHTATPASAKALLGGAAEIADFRRLTLLSDALLRNAVGWVLRGRPNRPRHAVVFGGTQVGKSTCVNVLLGANLAAVSHRGGFTRHAQAFVPNPVQAESLLSGNPDAFSGFTQVPPQQLRADRLDQYSVQPINQSGRIPDLVIWDAPDCDAIDSNRYMPGLIEVLSMADAVVYISSKEKYAVNEILEWVALLSQAGLNLLGCLNNTPSRQQTDILHDQREALNKVAQRHAQPPIPLETVALPFVDARTSDEVVSLLSDPGFAPGHALCALVQRTAAASRASRAQGAMRFVQHNLARVLEPALSELSLLSNWDQAVNDAVEQFMADYKTFFLDDAKRYKSFTDNKVALRILELLEIPGVHKAMRSVRSVLRLPARAVIWVGKKAYAMAFQPGEEKAPAMPSEVKTYLDAHTRLLNTLADVIEKKRVQNRRHPFWDVLSAQWADTLSSLNEDFRKRLDEHWQITQQRIDKTADAVYEELKKNPTQLNALRAGRFAADLAAIGTSVVATMHGDLLNTTHILEELIVGPALLSVIENVSSSIASNYVDRRETELRNSLIADSREFVEELYRPALTRLAQAAMGETGFLGMDRAAVQTLPERIDKLSRSLPESD